MMPDPRPLPNLLIFVILLSGLGIPSLYAQRWLETTWADFHGGVDSAIVITDAEGGELRLAGLKNVIQDFSALKYGHQWYGTGLLVKRCLPDSVALIYAGSTEAPRVGARYLRWFDHRGIPLSESLQLDTKVVVGQGAVDGQGRILLFRFESDTLYLVRYTASGEKLQAIQVSKGGRAPHVATNNSGQFVVTSVTGGKLWGQLHDNGGAQVGNPFLISNSASGGGRVAMNDEGQFVVTWATGNYDLRGRIYDRYASPVGESFMINDSSGNCCYNHELASNSEGRFVVSWHQDPPVTIMGQLFDRSGQKVGKNFRIVDADSLFILGAKVAIDDQGSFLIVWEDDRIKGSAPWPHEESLYDIFGQYYNSKGEPIGPNVKLNHYQEEIYDVRDFSRVTSTFPGQFLLFRYDTDLLPRCCHTDLVGTGWSYEESTLGTYTSQVHVFERSSGISRVSWASIELPGTGIRVWVRASGERFNVTDSELPWQEVFDGQTGGLPQGEYAQYRVRMYSDTLGVTPVFESLTLEDTSTVSTQSDFVRLPETPQLLTNYPNPFNPITQIVFQTPVTALVRIEVLDIQGRPVITLLNSRRPPGIHTVTWDGRNSQGSPAASGVYLVRLTVNHRIPDTLKIVLLR